MTPGLICPWCGINMTGGPRYMNARAAAVESKPGAFGICGECAQLVRFDAQLQIVRFTDAELGRLPARDQEVLRLSQRAVISLDRRPASEREAELLEDTDGCLDDDTERCCTPEDVVLAARALLREDPTMTRETLFERMNDWHTRHHADWLARKSRQ